METIQSNYINQLERSDKETLQTDMQASMV